MESAASRLYAGRCGLLRRFSLLAAAALRVRDKLALGYKDGGEQTVKNIARPVRV